MNMNINDAERIFKGLPADSMIVETSSAESLMNLAEMSENKEELVDILIHIEEESFKIRFGYYKSIHQSKVENHINNFKNFIAKLF